MLILFQNFSKLQCPLDSGHYIPAGNISNHYNKCKLAKNGYDKDELLLPENCNSASKTIIIGRECNCFHDEIENSLSPKFNSYYFLLDPSLRGSILVQAASKDVNFKRGIIYECSVY